MRENDNQPGGLDRVGHSSVQAWSAGPIFPAVIAVVEVYDEPTPEEDLRGLGRTYPYADYVADFYAQPLDARLRYRAFELTMPGRDVMTYGSRDDAESAALGLLAYDAVVRTLRETAAA